MHHNKHNYLLLLTLIWIVCFVFAGSALAKDKAEKRAHGKEARLERVITQMKLTDAQRSEIRQIYKSSHEEIAAKKNSVREAKKKLNQALVDDLDEKEVQTRFQEVQKAKSELAVVKFNMSRKIQKTLTPAQRKEYQQAWKKRHKRGPNHKKSKDRVEKDKADDNNNKKGKGDENNKDEKSKK